MSFKDPGTITKGIGKLTPELWSSIIDAVKFVHKNRSDLISMIANYRDRRKVHRPWFLARLTKSKLVKPNKFIYAWERVQFTATSEERAWDIAADESVTSTDSSGEEFAYYAINTMESGNTAGYVAPGIDMESDPYPIDNFHMMPIGGIESNPTGDADPSLEDIDELLSNPIVQMWFTRTRSTDGSNIRYFFTASNSHDGDVCPTHSHP